MSLQFAAIRRIAELKLEDTSKKQARFWGDDVGFQNSVRLIVESYSHSDSEWK